MVISSIFYSFTPIIAYCACTLCNNKERIQAFEGIVVSRKSGGVSETFTVRKMSSGIGVERTFPLHSPKIAGITVVKKGKVRRAKLTFLKGLVVLQ